MNKLLLASLLLFLTAGAAVAGDVPQAEVFGGYSIQRLGMSDMNVLDFSDLSDLADGYGANLSSIETSKFLKGGFIASFTYNATSALGIEADLRYNSGDIMKMKMTVERIPVDASGKYSSFSLLAGPKFTLRKSNAVTPFAHALIGFDRAKISVKASAMGESMDEDLGSNTGLGVALGGGIDINAGKSFSIRLIQADYFLTRHEEETWNNMALSFGLVFRLGSK
jgi:opacity protein-like surface antigen